MSVALKRVIDTRWSVVSGPSKGQVHTFESGRVSIGRSVECDIVVRDPKCSRKHAQVEFNGEVFELEGLNANNPVRINGQPVTKSALKSGDLVTIGDSEIRFEILAGQEPSRELTLEDAKEKSAVLKFDSGTLANQNTVRTNFVQPNPPPFQMPPNVYQMPPRPAPPPGPRKPARSNKGYFVIGGVILIGVWLFSGSVKKKVETSIRTEQERQADIEAAQKLQEVGEANRRGGLNVPLEVRQAQENYVKGFRDFRKGQYERALESFQACLALQPDHALCNRYLRLSQRKFTELIQYNMVLGRKYRDQNQFRACRSAFRNVMVMVKDPGSKTYVEAKANFEACNSLAEGHF